VLIKEDFNAAKEEAFEITSAFAKNKQGFLDLGLTVS